MLRPAFAENFLRLFATHNVVRENALGPWNFEVVPQLRRKTRDLRCQLHPARKIQVLGLSCRR